MLEDNEARREFGDLIFDGTGDGQRVNALAVATVDNQLAALTAALNAPLLAVPAGTVVRLAPRPVVIAPRERANVADAAVGTQASPLPPRPSASLQAIVASAAPSFARPAPIAGRRSSSAPSHAGTRNDVILTRRIRFRPSSPYPRFQRRRPGALRPPPILAAPQQLQQPRHLLSGSDTSEGTAPAPPSPRLIHSPNLEDRLGFFLAQQQQQQQQMPPSFASAAASPGESVRVRTAPARIDAFSVASTSTQAPSLQPLARFQQSPPSNRPPQSPAGPLPPRPRRNDDPGTGSRTDDASELD